MDEFDWDAWIEERDRALLAYLEGDQAPFRAYCEKYHVHYPRDATVRMVAVHKAISGATTIDRKTRQRSKRWLARRGFQSLDDGDL